MRCKICASKVREIFKSKVLNKYIVRYFLCKNCGFLFTEYPYWLKEAYQLPITSLDTGIVQRNLYLSQVTCLIILTFFNPMGKFLDYGGGTGLFVRLMRDHGFDFYWYDKYATNIFANGFEIQYNTSYDLITSFETFEHFVEPKKEIENMLSLTQNIFFSTLLYGNKFPDPSKWWYFSFETGQHISFYTLKTLKVIANKYNLHLYTNGKNLHLLTEKKISSIYFNILLKMATKIPLLIPVLKRIKGIKNKTWKDFETMRNCYYGE